MSEISLMDFASQTFHLLIAPPAWGKTQLLGQWLSQSNSRFLYISPLRALADEVQALWPELWVVVPEEIVALDWESLGQESPDLVVIWDEVHLVKEWGESFRPLMLEAWFGFCLSGLRGVGLTATLTADVLCYLKASLSEAHTHLIVGDAGNMQFKFPPQAWRVGDSAQLLFALNFTAGRTLIFCSSRQQVDQLVLHFSREQKTWGCKGGETKKFRERLERESPPEMIVATSCLSHGVNLPSVVRVVVLSDEFPDWLAHQMFTRGGRRGEAFEVWCPWKLAPAHFSLRLRALLSLKVLVMINSTLNSLHLWWHGSRRHRRSNYSSERA